MISVLHSVFMMNGEGMEGSFMCVFLTGARFLYCIFYMAPTRTDLLPIKTILHWSLTKLLLNEDHFFNSYSILSSSLSTNFGTSDRIFFIVSAGDFLIFILLFLHNARYKFFFSPAPFSFLIFHLCDGPDINFFSHLLQ